MSAASDIARTPRRTAGFSVLEAVIVLAISGLALTIIYSIGSRASQQGFRLGNRVLGLGDKEIALAGFQAVTSGLVVPSGLDLRSGDPRAPVPFTGDPSHVRAGLISPRNTACAPEGPSKAVELTIVSDARRTQVQCDSGRGPAVLMDLGEHKARFDYSQDGINWVETVTVVPGPAGGVSPDEDPRVNFGRDVFVRLSSDDGSTVLIGHATSGRPRPPPIDPNAL